MQELASEEQIDQVSDLLARLDVGAEEKLDRGRTDGQPAGVRAPGAAGVPVLTDIPLLGSVFRSAGERGR